MPIPVLTASAPPKKFELCPQESVQGCLVRAYYIGTHVNKYEPGNKPMKKIVLFFELDQPRLDGSGNHVLNTTVTFSVNEKSGLTKLLKPAMGSNYPDKPGQSLDINTLIDRLFNVQVIHTVKGDKTYANIGALTQLTRGMVPFSPTMDSFVWCYDDPVDSRVPEWVAKLASECIELGGVKTTPKSDSTHANGHVDHSYDSTGSTGDIPF
ncbi:MAG: hypothetical protein RLZZ573_488 [Pseudomonadota bacterium]|jgi:hypothetical protein